MKTAYNLLLIKLLLLLTFVLTFNLLPANFSRADNVCGCPEDSEPGCQCVCPNENTCGNDSCPGWPNPPCGPGGPGGGCTDQWSDWSGWSACNTTCGAGTQSRSRSCTDTCGNSCGSESQTQACNPGTCPVISGGLWELPEGGSCLSPQTKRINSTIDTDRVTKGAAWGSINIVEPNAVYSLTASTNLISNPANSMCVTNNIAPSLSEFGSTARYRLRCINTSGAGVTSQYCGNAGGMSPGVNYTVNLGFEVITPGWFHVIQGDIFGGCSGACTNGISLLLPQTSATSTYTTNPIYLLDESASTASPSRGLAVTPKVLSVKSAGGAFENRVSDGDATNKNYNVAIYANSKFIWPSTGGLANFSPPVGATQITGASCTNFFSSPNGLGSPTFPMDRVYYMTGACFTTAATGANRQYRGNGAALLYVTANAPGDSGGATQNVTVANSLTRTSGANSRLVILIDGSLTIAQTVGSAAVSLSSLTPHIDATLITKDRVLVNCTNAGQICDTTLVVGGSVLSKEQTAAAGTLSLLKRRTPNTSYLPTEIFMFNPQDIVALNNLTNSGILSNLSIEDIKWQTK
ncbi:MAG: thrombospondin type-1 domain-containing protein [Patescibacteria group bacterium]